MGDGSAEGTRARTRMGEERHLIVSVASTAPGNRSALSRSTARGGLALHRGGLAHPPRSGDAGPREPGADQHVSERHTDRATGEYAEIRAGANPWHIRVTRTLDRAPASAPRPS